MSHLNQFHRASTNQVLDSMQLLGKALFYLVCVGACFLTQKSLSGYIEAFKKKCCL